MKHLIRRKLPALILSAVMMLSLMPTALAADCGHNSWGSWQKLNDQQHQRTCLVSGCNAVQTANHSWPSGYEMDASSHWKKCTDCGAQTAHEAHQYSGSMKSDANNHWDQCTVCGYKDNLGGHVDLNEDGKCDTCGYSMPSSTITVTFKNGSSTYRTQSIKKGNAPSNPGTPSKSASGKVYTFKGWTTSNPGSSAVYDGQSYLTSSGVSQTPLNTNTTYYAVYTVSSKADSIVYEVDPGKSVSFSRTDFRDVYEDVYDDDFDYVDFYPDSSYKSSVGYIYYDYKGKNEERLDRNDLKDNYFEYSSSSDYPLDKLTFVADQDAGSRTLTIDCTLHGEDHSLDTTLEIKIGRSSSSSSGKADIVYEVDPDDTVDFDRSDFEDYFEKEYDDDDFDHVVFYPDSSYKSSNGYLYYDYKGNDEERISKTDLEDYTFKYSRTATYAIDYLTFVADEDADGNVVRLDFTAYGDDEELDGVVEIRIGDVDEEDADKGDIDYTVEAGDTVDLDRSDFYDFFQDEYDDTTPRYVTFDPDSSYKSSNGYLYYDYDGRDEERFSKSDLSDYRFYYNDDKYGDYELDELTFVADKDFSGTVSINFTIWYDSKTYVKGTLTIRAKTTAVAGDGSILYSTTYSSLVQLNHNDFARFFKEKFPNETFKYVKFTSLPASGTLNYDYYNTSKYGKSVRLTSSNCAGYSFYFSPSSTSDYALSELTFSPSGFNYCPEIGFTAYGSNSKAVSGTVLISVTLNSMPEVYGVASKGASVSFPASSLSSAVSKGTGMSLGSIRLLELPESSVGTIYVGSGTSVKASTSTKYTYSSGSQSISQLRFVPASNFTGSVEIPYVAYSSTGNAIACGKLSLGIVKSVPKFKDVTSSTWCYKYVVEMNDAGVIDGYADGSFRPDNTVTYGQALKLIMLAAGYKTQNPTGSHWASGYLTKAQSDKLISGTVNLDAPITRLAVAQIAAKAMKLSTSDLSSVKPFTDTTDIYVQALSAAGIVQGYFSNGTSTYKPGNTLTRGQVAAIVWRMENYQG
ncbi:S-layer homology domain-containing protein [uncultured Oscillibacter sp.]|uniref:S-layer homology domain-containing protein n=1 Tax=uncultured Oscillibacter sp. TaxID=876091 RepID=UPI0025D19FE7|nr:S-layer homology domain-containing protein [uncultured Oscillibacter sp.]